MTATATLELVTQGSSTTDNTSAELAELLVRCAAQDQRAFAELYDRTSRRLFGLIVRILPDRRHAEDVLQEVYLQVWRQAHQFQAGRGSALTWLLTIAHRRAVDRVRSEVASTARTHEYGHTHVTVEGANPPLEAAEDADTRRSVHQCLDGLTAVQRQSIELAYFGGKSYSEVASTLGAALPTVKSRIRDGLLRLKACLGVEMA